MSAIKAAAVAQCAVLLGSLCSGCTRPTPGASDDRLVCGKRQCRVLSERRAGEFPETVKGAELEIRDFRPFCRLDVSWRVLTTPAVRYHAMIDAQEGEALPLPLGFVQIYACRGLETPAPSSRPYAVLILNPEIGALPALGVNDAFVPLDGDASLDETFFASAHIEPLADGKGAAPSVRVVARSRTSRPEEGDYAGLHEGDSFPWGPAEARIVRIVSVPDRHVVPGGWVEVSLSPRPSPSQN